MTAPSSTKHNDEGGGDPPPDRLAGFERLSFGPDDNDPMPGTQRTYNNFRASSFIIFTTIFAILTSSMASAESGIIWWDTKIVSRFSSLFLSWSTRTLVECGLFAAFGNDKFRHQRLAARGKLVQNEIRRSPVCCQVCTVSNIGLLFCKTSKTDILICDKISLNGQF